MKLELQRAVDRIDFALDAWKFGDRRPTHLFNVDDVRAVRDALKEAKAQRLADVIRSAPHDEDCVIPAWHRNPKGAEPECNCWKRDALAGEEF